MSRILAFLRGTLGWLRSHLWTLTTGFVVVALAVLAFIERAAVVPFVMQVINFVGIVLGPYFKQALVWAQNNPLYSLGGILAFLVVVLTIIIPRIGFGRRMWRRTRRRTRIRIGRTTQGIRSIGVVLTGSISTLAYAIGFIALWMYLPDTAIWILRIALIITLILLIYPLVPNGIKAFEQKPNRYRPDEVRLPDGKVREPTARDYPPSKRGFFVFPSEGRTYRIEFGQAPLYGFMLHSGHTYRGEVDHSIPPWRSEYWEEIETPPGHKDSHPVSFPRARWNPFWGLYAPLSISWFLWKRYVYFVTRAVFTGFYPFQAPRVYPMEHFKRVTLESGQVVLIRVEDYSNHYRNGPFQFPVLIANVDTQDKIPIKVLVNVIAHVYNAFMTAYRTDDDWPTRFIASITDAVTRFARRKPLDELWTAKDREQASALGRKIKMYGEFSSKTKTASEAEDAADGAESEETIEEIKAASTLAIGIKIVAVHILDMSPMNQKDVEALGEVARAKVQRDSDKERAVGKAAYTETTIDAYDKGGKKLNDNPAGMRIAGMERDVRIAESAGKNGNTVVLGLGGEKSSSENELLAAILHEVRGRSQNDNGNEENK